MVSGLSADHREKFHVVRLNGFIHTDDKSAAKEIWRQLGREMEVGDDLGGKVGHSTITFMSMLTPSESNYADILASLLALLSHPSEISESPADRVAKSVIFVLDEFDLFTTHPR